MRLIIFGVALIAAAPLACAEPQCNQQDVKKWWAGEHACYAERSNSLTTACQTGPTKPLSDGCVNAANDDYKQCLAKLKRALGNKRCEGGRAVSN